MTFLGTSDVATLLPWPELISSIEATITEQGAISPPRSVHTIDVADGDPASLLVKPAWVVGKHIAVKIVTFFGDNGARDLPTVNAGVMLFDATNGTLVGACDGNELTTRRTAAASAVAAKRLARPGAQRLLVIGSGALAPMAAQAHAAVRDYDTIEVWGRREPKATEVVDQLVALGLPATVSTDLDASVAAADVISAVTGSTTPLIKGALLQPGTHVDLIGAFTLAMRESDDDAVRRARIFVDTREDGVLGGDLGQPLEAGVISADDIEAELVDLIDGSHLGRESADEITLYKSAGMALQDLAAARLVFGVS